MTIDEFRLWGQRYFDYHNAVVDYVSNNTEADTGNDTSDEFWPEFLADLEQIELFMANDPIQVDFNSTNNSTGAAISDDEFLERYNWSTFWRNEYDSLNNV